MDHNFLVVSNYEVVCDKTDNAPENPAQGDLFAEIDLPIIHARWMINWCEQEYGQALDLLSTPSEPDYLAITRAVVQRRQIESDD